jgi:TerB-C domain
MPELLIDAINERALDTIGDIILEPGPDTGVSIIAQEYRDQVATLISTYGV